ncbi:MAG TPA: protease complex subunit PrcB family protein [Longimicrobiales bacterium]
MRRAVLGLLFWPLFACSETEPLALELRSEAPPALHPVHNTLYSNLREPRRLLIRDAETWAAVWTEMISMGDPRTPPFVDFTKEDVIVAALGERRASGFGIAVTSLSVGENGTRVIVTTTVPGANCDRAEIITAPLDAVRVAKLPGPLSFDERSAVRTCG